MLIPTRTSFVTLGVFTLVYMMMNIIYGGFDIGKRKSKPIIYSFILSVLFTDITAHFFMCIMNITVIHHGRFVYDYPLLLILAYLLQNSRYYHLYLRRKLPVFFDIQATRFPDSYKARRAGGQYRFKNREI